MCVLLLSLYPLSAYKTRCKSSWPPLQKPRLLSSLSYQILFPGRLNCSLSGCQNCRALERIIVRFYGATSVFIFARILLQKCFLFDCDPILQNLINCINKQRMSSRIPLFLPASSDTAPAASGHFCGTVPQSALPYAWVQAVGTPFAGFQTYKTAQINICPESNLHGFLCRSSQFFKSFFSSAGSESRRDKQQVLPAVFRQQIFIIVRFFFLREGRGGVFFWYISTFSDPRMSNPRQKIYNFFEVFGQPHSCP